MAVLANQLGLDNNPGWGMGRIALFIIGLIAYGLSALSYLAGKSSNSVETDKNLLTKIRTILKRISQLINSPITGWAFGIFVCLGIAFYALWYSSAGRLPAFPQFDNDYIQLGESFLHGQLSLLEQPSPELAALKNPYDYLQRENIPYHWDASYYEGKYYLYWGPVPALAFAAVEGLTHTQPFASVMVDLPYIGLSLVLLVMFFQISRRFFPEASSLSPGLFILVSLVNLPFLFLLGNPQIYHTSIIYGQFFLLLGLLGWVIYIHTENPAWLLIAGLGWGLAIGSRVNLAVSVAIYLVFSLAWTLREGGWKPSFKREGVLLIPLALCVFGLGAYNFARFGNPFETGQLYQLTIPVAHSSYFSISYLPSNLYIYLLYPLTFAGKFPFVKSALFDTSLLPGWLNVPSGMAFDHNIFGILTSAPVLWLLGLAVPLSILRIFPGGRRQINSNPPSNLDHLFLMVTLAGVGQFLFLMVFFFGAERYVPDFYLPLIVGTAILVWRTDEIFKSRLGLRIALWSIVVGLAVWTIGIGFFGGFGVPPELFRSFNPALYNQIASYWNDRFGGFIILIGRVLKILFNRIH
jgi:hypothetical protein